MTDVEARFVTAFREQDTTAPGLVMEDDGTVWLVAPGGARTRLGGQAAAVSCFLKAAPMNIRAQGVYPILWDEMYDNIRDRPPFVSVEPRTTIPAGLGLDFEFDGTGSGQLEPTEAGVWAFTLAADASASDATWNAYIADDIIGEAAFHEVAPDTARNAMFTTVLSLPFYGGSAGPIFQVITNVAATGNPFTISPLLVVTRLG